MVSGKWIKRNGDDQILLRIPLQIPLRVFFTIPLRVFFTRNLYSLQVFFIRNLCL